MAEQQNKPRLEKKRDPASETGFQYFKDGNPISVDQYSKEAPGGLNQALEDKAEDTGGDAPSFQDRTNDLPQEQEVLGKALTEINGNLQMNKDIEKQQSLLRKKLNGFELNDEEYNQLPPDLAAQARSNDIEAIGMSIRRLNQTRQGRANKLQSNIQYLESGYQKKLQAIQQEENQARKEVTQMIEIGPQAFAGMSSKEKRIAEREAGYAPGYLDRVQSGLEFQLEKERRRKERRRAFQMEQLETRQEYQNQRFLKRQELQQRQFQEQQELREKRFQKQQKKFQQNIEEFNKNYALKQQRLQQQAAASGGSGGYSAEELREMDSKYTEELYTGKVGDKIVSTEAGAGEDTISPQQFANYLAGKYQHLDPTEIRKQVLGVYTPSQMQEGQNQQESAGGGNQNLNEIKEGGAGSGIGGGGGGGGNTGSPEGGNQDDSPWWKFWK